MTDNPVPLPAAVYRTIVADPPWRYQENPAQPRGGRGPGSYAENHYPTMRTEELATIPVGDLAEPDSALYLWVTNPILLRQRPTIAGSLGILELVTGWGFEPKALLTWHKLGGLGLGWYFRGDTEHIIYAIRGNVRIPPELRASNHFAARRGQHSAKPDRFYEIVERVSPGPYLEMFARRRRYGWDVWGDEAPGQAASQAEMGLGA